jgi:hypothetical protein
LKQNKKIRSETKIFLKRNKAKIGSINFALVGSKIFEATKAKRSKKTNFRLSVQNGSCFALKQKICFGKTGAP